jgi:dCTP diphosphatase
MNDKETPIEEIKKAVQTFSDNRDWAQYHSPKNLSMGLAIEASELMEHFLWKTQAETEQPADLEEVSKELADIFIYTLNLASRLNLDLAACAEKKLQENDRKYPADRVKGKSHKHTYYNNNHSKD